VLELEEQQDQTVSDLAMANIRKGFFYRWIRHCWRVEKKSNVPLLIRYYNAVIGT